MPGGSSSIATVAQPIAASPDDGPSSSCSAFDFEVFGKVQKVGWRRHQAAEMERLGATGTINNTKYNPAKLVDGKTFTRSVQGTIYGSKDALAEMEEWLSKTGSKRSRIDHAVISNRRDEVSASEIPAGVETNRCLPLWCKPPCKGW